MRTINVLFQHTSRTLLELGVPCFNKKWNCSETVLEPWKQFPYKSRNSSITTCAETMDGGGNYAKFLKNVHTEQVTKLNIKNQNECDLLEDIRNYIVKRSAIERSYSEALLKISSAFLNRKIANIPDIKGEGSEEKWNMWNVWRTVLEENEKLARARLAAVEVFSEHVADDAKLLRAHKLIVAKKCLDQLAMIQKELQTCVQEVDKTKKLYFDEEHGAHDVREKAKDIEEKLKKKKGSFFQSITSLQKNSAKVSSKREVLEEKSSGARNDYLLALASANAHQTRYFVVDFQQTIQLAALFTWNGGSHQMSYNEGRQVKMMESHVYDKVSEYLNLIARTELLTCTATQTSFSRIKERQSQLTREYNLQCVYLTYPVLKQHVQYTFEPCDGDAVDHVTTDHTSAAATLAREASRWAARIARETANIHEYQFKLQSYAQLRESGQKTDPNDPNGPDIETKMDELRTNIRRAETGKAKAEARIECLKAGGINVDEYIQDIESLNLQDMPRSSSSMSVRTDASGTGDTGGSDSMYDSDYNDTGSETAERPASRTEEEERPDSAEVDGEWAMLEQERQRIEQLTAGWDDPTQVDWGPEDTPEPPPAEEESVEATAPPVDPSVPVYKCTALYTYTAQNPDELSMVESEQLEMVGEGDGDGWIKARNYRGQEGYVPSNYLDVEYPASDPTQQLGASQASFQLASQISFSSVDYTVDEEPSEISTGVETIREINKPSNLDLTGGSMSESEATTAMFCIAMYDYDATCDEELTFTEGQIIRIHKKCVHDDVDDGWWMGQLGDIVGLFPSLVVEECNENGEPLTPQGDESPPGSAPPVFTPPDVPTFLLAPQTIVTQPTPMVESNPILGEGSEKKDEPFSLELTRDQQQHYETQFDEDAAVATVQIAITTEDDDEIEDKKEEGGDDDGGLGVAQIVITAATPMCEDAEKSFPPPPEEQSVENGEQEADMKPDCEDVAGCKETKPTEPTPKVIETTVKPIETVVVKGRIGKGSKLPSEGSSTEDETTTGPSTADNSQSDRQQPIPDELEPHQLARLQDLKESDA